MRAVLVVAGLFLLWRASRGVEPFDTALRPVGRVVGGVLGGVMGCLGLVVVAGLVVLFLAGALLHSIGSGGSSPGGRGGDIDCGARGPMWVGANDPYHLDGDGDGVGCE